MATRSTRTFGDPSPIPHDRTLSPILISNAYHLWARSKDSCVATQLAGNMRYAMA